MKILYLAHRIPYPPNKGDKLRAFQQLTHLARRHDVWCACFVDDPDDLRHAEPLRRLVRGLVAIPLNRKTAGVRGLWGMLCGSTVTEHFYRSPPMQQALRALSRTVSFDAVAAFSSGMAPFALSVPTSHRVLDLCDLDSAKWHEYARFTRPPRRWLYHREGLRLAERERAWIDAFDASILISLAERRALGDGVDPGKVHVVTNGVEMPTMPLRRPRQRQHELTSGPTVGFVGVMDYRPNIDAVSWFAQTCWPAIRRAVPRATFRIVGRGPTRHVRQLAAIEGIVVTGEVADVQRELAKFDLSIAPLRIARGLQNKVLEAMAAGVPVLATGKAFQGIDAVSGQDLVVADEPETMIRSAIALCCDDERRAQVAEAGRRFVATHHRWEQALQAYELIVTGSTQPRTHAVDPMPLPAPSRQRVDVSTARR